MSRYLKSCFKNLILVKIVKLCFKTQFYHFKIINEIVFSFHKECVIRFSPIVNRDHIPINEFELNLHLMFLNCCKKKIVKIFVYLLFDLNLRRKRDLIDSCCVLFFVFGVEGVFLVYFELGYMRCMSNVELYKWFFIFIILHKLF